VSPSTANLEVGASQQFTATLQDAEGTVVTGRTVTWGSSAPSVAVVTSNGRVTAVAPGTARITAACEGKNGGATVTVSTPLSVSTTSLRNAMVGVPYSDTLHASGGTGAYTWGLRSVYGPLPDGLTLSSNGIISGVPATFGSATVHVWVTDGAQTAWGDLQIYISPPPLSISTTSLSDGIVGRYYSEYLSATGGTGSYNWSIVAGALPTGLRVVYSATGYIGGTPTVAGTSSFTAQVSSAGLSATRVLAITVLPVLQITTSSLPNATVGVAYSDTLRAAGGTGEYVWNLQSGLLPAGLTLSGAGVLAGTPTTQWVSTFIVEVTSGAQSQTRVMSLTVAAP